MASPDNPGSRILIALLWLLAVTGCERPPALSKGERFVAASDAALHYAGRWDLTDPTKPRASWPGFAISMNIEGRAISVLMTDTGNYYNVEIDGKATRVIGGGKGKHLKYVLSDDLTPGIHRLQLQRRNITFEDPTVIEGFIVDESAKLSPPAEPTRRIEFIGDSFTAAEGNEAQAATLKWEEKYSVTNFATGYAALIGKAMNAEVTAVCRSGSGLVCDWKGLRKDPMGERYGWTQMEMSSPAWKFEAPHPDLVVISLGLNDHSGLKKADGSISPEDSLKFREAYQALVAQVRLRHPGTRIVALASYLPWTRENIGAVVAAEKAAGHDDLSYAEFDKFPDGYVADGHPSVATHHKMAEQILTQFARSGISAALGAAGR